jgi:aryl-alcohol dehydrogenase-like predicted oxidoreductase
MQHETTTAGIPLGDAHVPRVGLGTNRLNRTRDHVSFVREAVAAGVRHIDTAYLYTGGESEETIGEALVAGSDGVVVATKGGYAPGTGRPDVLRSQLDESLRRLRVETIDLYYLHRAHEDTPFEETIGALAAARDEGKIRHVGLSQVGVDQIERARAIVPVVAVQNHYNLAERGWDHVVDHCERVGIVFVPYFPLKGAAGPELEAIAARHAATTSQIRLAWLLRRSPVVLPIPGTLSLGHVRENLAALEIELTDEEFSALS